MFTIAKNQAAVPRNSLTGNRDGQEVHRHDRAGGVGHHRGEAAERAVGRGGDAVRSVFGDRARPSGAGSSVIAITASRMTPIDLLDPHVVGEERGTRPPAGAGDHRGGQPQQRLPVRVPPIGEHGEDVRDDQQQQERPGRLLRRAARRRRSRRRPCPRRERRSSTGRRRWRRRPAAPTRTRSDRPRQTLGRRSAASASAADVASSSFIHSGATTARMPRPLDSRQPTRRPPRPSATRRAARRPRAHRSARRPPRAEVSTPMAVRQTSAMPRTTRPPMIGETPTTGADVAASASRMPGTARIGPIETTGFDGAISTTSAVGDRLERHRVPGAAASMPGVLEARRLERRAVARPPLLEVHRASRRSQHDARRVDLGVGHRKQARAERPALRHPLDHLRWA